MKKVFILVLFLSGLFVSESDAQFRFGAGVDVWLEGETTLGIQGKAIYDIQENLGLNGSLTYYLSDLLDYSLDVAVQYTVINGESLKLSPLAGFDMTRVSFLGLGSTNTALQVGALLELPIGGMNAYIEPKLIIDDGSALVISGGVMF